MMNNINTGGMRDKLKNKARNGFMFIPPIKGAGEQKPGAAGTACGKRKD